MDLKDYQQQALKTAIYPHIGSNILYPTLGLIGEIIEVADLFLEPGMANKEEVLYELGDVLWYVAVLSFEIHCKVTPLQDNTAKTPERTATRMIQQIGSIAQVMKRIQRDTQNEVTPQQNQHLANSLSIVVSCVQWIAQWYGVDLDHIMLLNLGKLQDRQKRQALQGIGNHR